LDLFASLSCLSSLPSPSPPASPFSPTSPSVLRIPSGSLLPLFHPRLSLASAVAVQSVLLSFTLPPSSSSLPHLLPALPDFDTASASQAEGLLWVIAY
jgi:hypothetical protein